MSNLEQMVALSSTRISKLEEGLRRNVSLLDTLNNRVVFFLNKQEKMNQKFLEGQEELHRRNEMMDDSFEFFNKHGNGSKELQEAMAGVKKDVEELREQHSKQCK